MTRLAARYDGRVMRALPLDARPILLAIAVAAPAPLPLRRPRAAAAARPAGRPRASRCGPPPTAEDWKKPCLIKWQRTWEDALAVSKETGKPILVCVNMDGEIASEHYAGVRYRQPEIAKLYEPYVCVIASVYRHTPRDYDEQGRRILCPRFGSVTCGEHIAIEPCSTTSSSTAAHRAAPHRGRARRQGDVRRLLRLGHRHDLQLAPRRHREPRRPPPPMVRGDRPLVEHVASRDNAGPHGGRAGLRAGRPRAAARAARGRARERRRGAGRPPAPGDLRPRSADRSRSRGRALAQSTSEGAVDLIGEALRVPMEPPRDATR